MYNSNADWAQAAKNWAGTTDDVPAQSRAQQIIDRFVSGETLGSIDREYIMLLIAIFGPLPEAIRR